MAKLVVGGYHYTYIDLVFIVPDINSNHRVKFWGPQLPYMAPWVGFKSHAAIAQRLSDHQSPKSTIGGVTM